MVSAGALATAAALDAAATRRCLRRRWAGCAGVAVAAVLLATLSAWSWSVAHGIGASPPLPWPVPTIAALVAGAITVDVAVRLHRTRTVLAVNPWVEVRSQIHRIDLQAGPTPAVTMLELHGAPDDGVVVVASAGVRARPMADLAGRAWVAGDDRRFYLAAPGGAPLIRAKRVRSYIGPPAAYGVLTPLRSRVLPGQ